MKTDLPTKVGVYTVITPDKKVKLRVVYNHPNFGLYVAENIGEIGCAKLKDYVNAGYQWFGPMEIPQEPKQLLNNFLNPQWN